MTEEVNIFNSSTTIRHGMTSSANQHLEDFIRPSGLAVAGNCVSGYWENQPMHITKANQLLLLRKIIRVKCKNRTKHTYIHCMGNITVSLCYSTTAEASYQWALNG
jgi:hypothetical protein